jgi:predicted secreted protein
MGVSTSRPSYVSRAVVGKRKTSSLPAFETDLSPACNNKKARRRSNEDDSPLPTGTPLFNEDEHIRTSEDASQAHHQAIVDKVVTRASFPDELLGDTPSTEAGPTVAAPQLPPDTITKTRITTTTVTETSETTPDGKTTLDASSTRRTTSLIGRAEVPSTADDTPSFEDRIVELKEYFDEHGHFRVHCDYKAGPTKKLGWWLKGMRRSYTECLNHPSYLGVESPGIVLGPNKLSKLRIERLKAMGFELSVTQRMERAPEKSTSSEDLTPSFEDRIVELKEYFDEHGHLRVHCDYRAGRTKKLGWWLKGVRRSYTECLTHPSYLGVESPWIILGPNKLSKLRIERLEAVGIKWSEIQRRTVPAPASTAPADSNPSFEDRLVELQEYYDAHGHLRVTCSYKGSRNKKFGLWVKGIRNVYQKCLQKTSYLGEESPAIVLGPNKLSKLRIERLEAIGLKWTSELQQTDPATASKKVAAARSLEKSFEGHHQKPSHGTR